MEETEQTFEKYVFLLILAKKSRGRNEWGSAIERVCVYSKTCKGRSLSVQTEDRVGIHRHQKKYHP